MATRAAGVACPFCGGAGRYAFEATDRNREISAERFAYARCKACGTIFIDSAPSDLARYYAPEYYRIDPDGEPSWKHEQPLIDSASYRVALIERYATPGHLIEIGAGTGAFASAAQSAGFEVSAIEMDQRCCDYLSGRGIRAICTDRPLDALELLPAARAVAMWHVLEHLANPSEILERVVERLEPGGVLAIGVPNASSLQFRIFEARFAHLDAPRHLSLIPPASLVRKGEQLGLRCVEITTNDPDGVACNEVGWIQAFQSRPAVGTARRGSYAAMQVTRRVLAPFERTRNRGSAVTLVMRKPP